MAACRRCGTTEKRANGYCAECQRRSNRKHRDKAKRDDPAVEMYFAAKKRARRKQIPFTITQEDVRAAWPSGGRCPVLGVVLRTGAGTSTDASPTLDRINTGWGYEPGNIAVISHKANRAKNTLSASELQMLAKWMRDQGMN